MHLVFWPLAALAAGAIARHNGFGIKDALLAAIGRKAFRRTRAINLLIAGVLILPLGLGFWIVQTCPA